MKDLEAFVAARVEEAVTKTENKFKGLVGMTKSHLPDIYKADRALGAKFRDHLLSTNMVDVETMDPEPEVVAAKPASNRSKGKEKEPQGPVMVCGCITKDKKKPCQRRGVAEYGGRCGHHKNSEGPRVTSVETVVVAAEPKSEPMAIVEPGPSEPPVPMTTTKVTVKTAPAEVVEDPEEVERRQADFSEEERKMVEEMTSRMGMVGEDGEVLHEELEEWDPFEGEEEDEDVESDEMDYE
ncbi:MAG: hypothetical protein ACO3SE_09745 [Sedimenticolaceae bacterium]